MSKYVDTVTFKKKKLESKVINPWMTFDPKFVEVTCVTLPKDHCPRSMKIHQNVWIQWPFFQKFEPKVIFPYMTFDPTSVEVTCVTLPKDHCVQVPWEYISVCPETVINFSQNFNQLRLPHTTYYVLHTE